MTNGLRFLARCNRPDITMVHLFQDLTDPLDPGEDLGILDVGLDVMFDGVDLVLDALEDSPPNLFGRNLAEPSLHQIEPR